ncbi:major facilitator superfamily transporter monocarboxylate [Niveomyces insectorum RCEF 264]|uniref:Major facilitator superfamily transporter monocarboxylate n=1 Tax=Niveomyces insectorum RCEF 264 TaxID=1081102 RepID=A0A167LU56_9HYPO|nr:major facilitator superfamily transporter monocarboxylate [Niveomyces insectorum RCEF 264]
MPVSSLHAEDSCLKNHASSVARNGPADVDLAPATVQNRSSDVTADANGLPPTWTPFVSPGDAAAINIIQYGGDPEKQEAANDRTDGEAVKAGHNGALKSAETAAAPVTPSLSSSSSSSSSSAPHVTFPEGGLQAWLVVLGSFCAMFSVFGLINTAAVFESWFATHQLAAYTASEIGWVFSLYLFMVFFVGIQVGPVFDRHGPRWLVALGSVLVVASILLLGLCEEYYQILLCYSVLGGLGGALLNTPAYACIAHFFNARRGLATGIATTSGGVGGIVFPLLLQHLLPRVGFAWSTRVLGFILLGLAVPSNLWLRTRLPLAGSSSAAPGSASRRNGPRRRMHSVWPDLTIFQDKSYAVAAVGIFFMEWGIFVPLTFIVSYAGAHHQNTTQAYTLLSLLNAGSVAGRFLPGLLADRFGRFNVIIVTIALSSAVVLGVWLPAGASPAALRAFAVLFGFASGSNLGLIAVCLGQLCAPSAYGRFFATAMMVASFGTLSSVPIGGAILGSGASEAGWRGLIIFSGVSYALAVVCYLSARILAVGWGWRVKF